MCLLCFNFSALHVSKIICGPCWPIKFNLRLGFSSLRVHALLDGQMIVAGLVLLLNLVPLATNLVSCVSQLGSHVRATDVWRQFNYATSTVVIDADLCTITSPWSENFALLYVNTLCSYIWKPSDEPWQLYVHLFDTVKVEYSTLTWASNADNTNLCDHWRCDCFGSHLVQDREIVSRSAEARNQSSACNYAISWWWVVFCTL